VGGADEERVLVKDSAFAHALLLSLRSGLMAVDGGGRVAAISAEGAKLLGVAPRLGEPVEVVLAEQPEVLAQLTAARAGRAAPRAELTLRGASGALQTIGFTTLPVVGGGAAILFRDLTPLERQSEQERLHGRLAALGQMAAGLAHELRNPLAAIELLAGLLARAGIGEAEQKELAEEISNEVRGLAATVDACLAWVRPEPAQRSAALDVAALLADALRRARAQTPFAGDVALDVEPGLRVDGDGAQLRAALENLIVNAIQAMASAATAREPRIEVRASAWQGGGGVTLSVSDTGPGVSPELRERIFFPFFTTRVGGSGIGLAWVQKVAASHGGSVGVTERPGGGACFAIHLPREPRA
jgi:signal transduction histidine kinase